MKRVAAALALVAGCAAARPVDPLAPAQGGRMGRAVLSLLWSGDVHRDTTHAAQEFAPPTIAGDELVIVGSRGGTLRAFRQRDGREAWRLAAGSTSAQATVHGGKVYLGTDDGTLLALDAASGRELWRHAAAGAILHAPAIVGEVLVFSTDADQLVAVELASGKRRWQHSREAMEDFTLRGQAGVVTDGERVFGGFSDGHIVALAAQTGAVVWERSLAGPERKFVDVDATPVLAHGALYAASGTGGVYALDPASGEVKWQAAITGVTGLGAADDALYAAAAETGLHAFSLDGRLIWRQGLAGAGEPAAPVASGDYLFVATAARGLFVVDRVGGALFDSFDPGAGISATPVLDQGRLYLHSNGGLLYAMSIAN